MLANVVLSSDGYNIKLSEIRSCETRGAKRGTEAQYNVLSLTLVLSNPFFFKNSQQP
jgi:hypothetical protein